MYKAIKKIVTFKGRAQREEYWLFTLFYSVVGFISRFMDGNDRGNIVFFAIIIFALFIPSIAVTIRRLHDINKSGWWIFLSLIPFAGGLVLLIFFCFDGTKGENRFGPDPKGRQPDPAVD
jgi:uncharacterized membrane protein YhaH (DUF805 family)